jgi:hypothetical protein
MKQYNNDDTAVGLYISAIKVGFYEFCLASLFTFIYILTYSAAHRKHTDNKLFISVSFARNVPSEHQCKKSCPQNTARNLSEKLLITFDIAYVFIQFNTSFLRFNIFVT